MKTVASLIALLFAGSSALAQTLKVDAGPNICRADANPDSFRLGGYPAALPPFTGPVTYHWQLVGGVPATPFLDSPGIAHPKLLPFGSSQSLDSLDFELRVTDATGSSGTDTVRVYYARLTCTTASCGGSKGAGDTLQLFNSCTTGLNPLKYKWTPTDYLSDSTVATPKTWVPIPRIYTSVVTDRLGCRWHGECAVTIAVPPPPPPPPSGGPDTTGQGTNGIAAATAANGFVVAPSPLTSASTVTVPAAWVGASYKIISMDGRLLQSGWCTGRTVSLAACTAYPAGIYTFRIQAASGATEGVRFEVR